MFKPVRWRSEKNKIKAIFKLQFHVTQVPRSLRDTLVLSLIPQDTGRPTARLEKATIKDGNCYWEIPVYETVKFSQDPKNGKICERLYQLRVSTGMSKPGAGEVSIDFSDYVEGIGPFSVSFPLKNLNHDSVLHVLIQKMQENIDHIHQRGVDETKQTKIKVHDKSLRAQLSFEDTDDSTTSNSTEDGSFYKTNLHNVEPNGTQRSSGSDITLSSSEDGSGLDTPRELRPKDNGVHQEDPTSFLLSPIKSGMPLQTVSNGSEAEIEKLKSDLLALSRQAEVSELEIQTLRKQIVKESKRGQELSRETANLKQERDAYKSDCEKVKAIQRSHSDEFKIRNKSRFEEGDPRALVEELRQELNYEKDMNANLRLQLKKTQESNSELILAVQDLDEMLEKKDREISDTKSNEDEEQKELEELVKEHGNAREAQLLEQQVIDLRSEIEACRRDKDELEMQMEQLALDYEILKQENHDISYKLEQSQVQEQLRTQYECAGSFATICELEGQIESLENELEKKSKELLDSRSELEVHVKNLEEELEKQGRDFEADLESIMHAKVEEEKRAVKAEEALRLTRWKNASTAEKLQEEFRRLSTQMASTFDANEKVAMTAVTEASELRLQKSQLEESLCKANEDLQSAKDCYEEKILELSNELKVRTTQMEQMLLEIEDKSKQLMDQKKHEEEVYEELSREIERLKSNNDKLSEEGENLRAESEQIKTSMRETKMLVERMHIEKNELENLLSLGKGKVEKLAEELSSIRSQKDEKERAIVTLQTDLETLRAQCKDLKNSLLEDELEKKKLRKQVTQLKSDLKKEEDAFAGIEKKLKESNGRAVVSDGTKVSPRSNKSSPGPRGSKEVATLREKIKSLEGQIKQKEAFLETSTNAFLEKERDLHNKVEELENKVTQCLSTENGIDVSVVTSGDLISEEESKSAVISSMTEGNVDELLSEVALQKERNKAMEGELKEMQERYSEISLKFAEVEGERQMLVMTVRNLKNSTKS